MRNRDITFVTKDGVSKGVVNILGKVTTIMHKTVQTFEDTVEVEEPSELLEKSSRSQVALLEGASAAAGLYRLDIAIKDVNNPDHIGIFGRALDVPTYEDDKLGASSLILADEMNTVSSRQIGERQLHHQQYVCSAARGDGPGHACELQTQPGSEFLDAVL